MTVEAAAPNNTFQLWQKPISLISAIDEPHCPYPISCLPTIIHNAVSNYHKYGQQPLSLIACSALANVSLACQTLANVARDHMLVSPISLYFFITAMSGERKTASDHTFSYAIREWEQQTRKKLMPSIQTARAFHQAWLTEKKGMLAQIRRTGAMGQDTDALKEKYVELVENEPAVPLLPMLFFEDTTQEALASHIANGWPSASLWSDEGGIIVSSAGMQNNSTKFVALLNRLWDGKPFIAHRKTTESFTVANRRLTVSLMLQPIILQQLLTKGDGISRQSGFLARSLIAYPESVMGERYYQEPPESLSALFHFHHRLKECLDYSLSLDNTGCHEIPVISFNNRAKNSWIDFFNNTEKGLKKTWQWSPIKDFASKAAENAARLSALLHLFEGKQGQIDHEDMERAIGIIQWHLIETRRVLSVQPKTSQQQDAIKILTWITDKSLYETTPRYLQQFSPIREKDRRDKAIQLLIENYYLCESKIKGRTILLVNPQIYGGTSINE